jgi:hypothetical protein
MAKLEIDIGVEGNDGTGDSIRESFRKVNANFAELYAVFGIGGQIGFTDLSDTPNTYLGSENKIPVVRTNATGLSFVEFASDNALGQGADTVGFDFSQEGKIVFKVLSSNVSLDTSPKLGGPLDAGFEPIARVDVSQEAVDRFNAVHGTNINLGDLVIDKKYADRNYQEKVFAGGGLRLEDEPESSDIYSRSTSQIVFGNLFIPNHGITDGFNGAAFIFNSIGTDPSGVTSGSVYFIRRVDNDTISLHVTSDDAVNGQNRILLGGGSGVFTITDIDFDPSLQGNWLSTVAVPRKSLVRRQGDTMTGALTLHDHPGNLAGAGVPRSADDLQAVSKLYADSFDTTSQVNLYVKTSGNDSQDATPFGLEGRNPAYAFKTVNAACRKAEEIIISSPIEPGPYMQTITFGQGTQQSTLETKGFVPTSAIPSSRENARILIEKNKEFITREVVEYIKAEFPNFNFDQTQYARDLEFILDSVSLDALSGNNSNYLSRYAGLRYYSNPSSRNTIGKQRAQTLAAIEYARLLVIDFILPNRVVGTELNSTLYQTRVSQFIDTNLVPDSLADDVVDNKFNVIRSVIELGVLSAPRLVDGQTNYRIEISNGNFGFVDQGDPLNTDIITGKVVRGKISGAIGRIVSYTSGSDPSVLNSTVDRIELQLLEPKEFQIGETLEFGNFVASAQVTVNIESGIYQEDYPIRVPANTSINGDEFRRVIIRPKKRISQSRYADLFFYRDAEFDGLVLGVSSIDQVSAINPFDVNRLDGTYTVTDLDYTTNRFGKNAEFEITVQGGNVTAIEIVNGGEDFQKDDIISINGNIFGLNAEPLNITVDKIPNGIEYINPLTQEVDAYFGYHYVKDPSKLRNTGVGVSNIGKWTNAKNTLVENQNFISEQVVKFIENQFSISLNSSDQEVIVREAKATVNAIADDLQNGGNEFSLEKQGNLKDNKTTDQKDYLQIGIDYIYNIADRLLQGLAPTVIYGSNLEYPAPDLFNGSSEPIAWAANQNYKKGDIVRFFTAGVFRYYQAIIDHTSSSQFTLNEIQTRWQEINGPINTVRGLVDLILFAFSVNYNPPLRNEDMDVFLMNDATILRNITVQGHGGFMCVLDPEGQILTKSPYIQTGSSFSQSLNRQAFRGGMYIDAFVGNSAVQVTERIDNDPFRLRIQSLGSQSEPQGLFVRRPQTPCPFFIDGRRFQVNAVTEYDPDQGTAVLILDRNSNNSDGFIGLTSTLSTGVDLTDLSSPIPVTLQTAGNRSMLGNDFTQINDLGYGLVVNNGGLSEMVSMFTYYCWAGYYSNNGSQIRSLTGSTCYGEYGLIAEGSDPNEIPDDMFLVEDMVQSGRSYSSQVTLFLNGPITVTQETVILQDNSDARGTVVVDRSDNVLLLDDVEGFFNLTQQLNAVTEKNILAATNTNPVSLVLNNVSGLANGDEVTIFGVLGMGQLNNNTYYIGNLDGSSTVVDLFTDPALTQPLDGTGFNPYVFGGTLRKSISLGVNSIPYDTDTNSYINPREALFIHVYDFKDTPLNRSEFDVYHPTRNAIARYEVSNAQRTSAYAGRYKEVNTRIPTSTVSVGTGAEFTLYKTISQGYTVEIAASGSGYSVGDTFVVLGENLGGTSANNATILVSEIENGSIVNATVSGTIAIDSTTPVYSGQVYKLNFSTSGAEFSSTGLLEKVNFGEDINYRKNQVHILGDIQAPDVLTIRPSTAVVFNENKSEVYRSISFITTNSLGDPLESDQVQVGFDTGYDYIRLLIDPSRISETVFAGSGTTTGATPGDTVIALQAVADENEIFRLNNNSRTPEANRPVGWTVDTLTEEAPIFVWGGKKHYVYNYRGVTIEDGVPIIVEPAETNLYALVDIADVGEDINIPATATGLAKSLSVLNVTPVLRAGLRKDASGDVTVNISTCRATAHDFLEVGTGGFNQSNYPNVIFGLPREKNQANEVEERGKGRVFYVSSDQDGIFRVGRFFSVDQGTGTVTFSASIALSDVDGLGFKRGVVINEFSTDTGMTDNSTDTVPTESAVRGYVNRRLGFDHFGNLVNNVIGPGVLAKDGTVPLSGNLNAAGNTVTNLRAPIVDSDAATKLYVDQQVDAFSRFEDLKDIEFSSTIPNGDLIIYNGTDSKWNNISFSNDGTVSDATVTFTGGVGKIEINADVITNANISSNAAISQSKLNLNSATTRANATGITQADLGSASFRSSEFVSINGWIELVNSSSATTGVRIEKLQHISSNTVLGRTASGVGPVSEVAFSTIVDTGDGLQNADFVNVIPVTENPGQVLVKRIAGQSTPYGLSDVTFVGTPNSIVKTKDDGSIQVNSLILGGNPSYEILSLSGNNNTTLNIRTPGQGLVLTSTGSVNPDVRIPGSLIVGNGSVTQSSLQSVSTFNNRSRLAVDWMYSGFIEAPGERGAASTGVAIGAGTGRTAAGQIGIVVANSGNNSSVVPALFNAAGFRPDISSAYDIGTASFKYRTVFADLFSGTATEAFYADLAENYLGDQNYEPGTVLVFGGEYELTTTTSKGDRRVAGVVSSEPATLMNSALEGEFVVALALQGRVPCKVLGTVQKGDILVTSATPGYAIVNNDPKPGTIIGKSLENKTDDGKGVIEVVVGKH